MGKRKLIDSRDSVEKLNEAVTRLMHENARLRQKIEEAEVIIRRRAPSADGLSFAAAVKTILNDRDKAQTRVQFFREELKKVFQILANGDVKDALKEINQFLFNNPR